MSDSVMTPAASKQSQTTSTRIDQAHGLSANDVAEGPPPWLALAGRDASRTTEQLDRQTNELLSYVQRQNQEIDSRQAELNARLAQLDNELRAARLKSTQRTEDESWDIGAMAADNVAMLDEQHAGESLDEMDDAGPPNGSLAVDPQDDESPEPSNSDPITRIRPGEFDDVEEVVAEIADACGQPASESTYQPADPVKMSSQCATGPTAPQDVGEPIGIEPHDFFPFLSGQGATCRIDRSEFHVGIGGQASSLDATALESERRLLVERKIELDRRKLVLQRMQDETQAFHREALEMRMLTEQLWAELAEKTPADHLHQLLSSLRARLDDHYAATNQTISDRKAELVTLQSHVEAKQQELRQQSHKLQEWVETRHNDIKSHAAQLDARETLLNRREHRLHDEFSKWEAQQREYKRQLNGILRKLSLAELSHRNP